MSKKHYEPERRQTKADEVTERIAVPAVPVEEIPAALPAVEEVIELPAVPVAEPAPVVRIRILNGYRGRPSKERWIAPGVYAVDDPALFALADYLIENGHAVYIEED